MYCKVNKSVKKNIVEVTDIKANTENNKAVETSVDSWYYKRALCACFLQIWSVL